MVETVVGGVGQREENEIGAAELVGEKLGAEYFLFLTRMAVKSKNAQMHTFHTCGMKTDILDR